VPVPCYEGSGKADGWGRGCVLLLHSVNKSERHSRTITTDVHKMKILFAFILTILVLRKSAACLDLNFWK